ncbi:MAG: phage adaptor protein [bacterium]
MNFGDIQNAVLNALGKTSSDTNLNSLLPTWINNALLEIRLEYPYWSFLRRTVSITTTAGYSQYSLPQDYWGGLYVYVTLPTRNIPIPLELISEKEGVENYIINFQSYPRAYSLQYAQITIYPIPDASYPLTLIYSANISNLSQPTDTNEFLTDYPMMVIYRTLADAYLSLGEDTWHNIAFQHYKDLRDRATKEDKQSVIARYPKLRVKLSRSTPSPRWVDFFWANPYIQ